MNCLILAQFAALLLAGTVFAGDTAAKPELHVLAPVTRGNLTLFPVVGGNGADASHLLTLDEGLRAGTVVVTEAGSVQGLIRGGAHPQRGSAEVNRLVLLNNSDRPLLLLAGEVVTGGKQDRVIGADHIVPANSGPIDLSVFCVEPGRWVESSAQFSSMKSQMAQPSVRMPAMAARNQQQVWDRVASASSGMRAAVPQAAPAVAATTSYAKVMQNPDVEKRVAGRAADYDGLLHELRKVNARGVVVAINGRIVWADVFANTDLLEKYWQKLIRSYAAESIVRVENHEAATEQAAQMFLEQEGGTREVSETEPNLFRRTEISGNGYKVFKLTALTPKGEYLVHMAKMSYEGREGRVEPIGLRR
jgi:hypothetical protein